MKIKSDKLPVSPAIIFLAVCIIAVSIGFLYYNMNAGGYTVESVLNRNRPYYQKGKEAILNLTESIADDANWSMALYKNMGKEKPEDIEYIDTLDGKMQVLVQNIDGLVFAVLMNEKNTILSSSGNDLRRGYPFQIPFKEFGKPKNEDNCTIDGLLSEKGEIIISQSSDIKIHDKIYGRIFIAQHSGLYTRTGLKTRIVIVISAVLCLMSILLVLRSRLQSGKGNKANQTAQKPETFTPAQEPVPSVQAHEPAPSVQAPEPDPSVQEKELRLPTPDQKPVASPNTTKFPYVPEKFGRYNKIKQIFSGGMGEIYLATKDGMKTMYTIKTILNTYFDDDDLKKMFVKEAEIAESIKHRNIVGTYDYGIQDGTYYIVMEYIPGKNMFDIIKMLNSKTNHGREKLTVSQTVFILMNISKGLMELHGRKIIHRDISPQNIMVSIHGDVKIIDFGIAKSRTDPEKSYMTILKGKLPYLSPEQARREKLTEQTDIYSFGIIAYEFLFGRRLFYFNSEDDVKKYYTQSKFQVCPIDEIREDIPNELSMLIMKCLEKDQNRRYGSISVVFDELRAIKEGLSYQYDESHLEEFMRKHFKDDEDIRRYLESI